MTETPHHQPAQIGWADFNVLCPCCERTLASGDDWDNVTPNTWAPKPEDRFLQCEECGALLEAPEIRITLSWGGTDRP